MPSWKKVIISGSDAALRSLNVSTTFTASGLNYPISDNGEESFMQTDGSGNLTFQYVKTIYEQIYNGETTTILKGDPLYISGSQGANSIAFKADAANPAKMPVTYISADNIAPGATGRGIVLGLLKGIDTTGYPAGTEVYVAPGGGWTKTRPTGSNIIQLLGIVTKEGTGGQGIVLNPGPANLPNLTSGNVWVGNLNGFPVATPTSSLSVASASFATTSSYTTAISGTVNYIPKLLTGGTIGNSLIYDNGTSVGIGTTTPTRRLSIYTVSDLSQQLSIKNNNSTLLFEQTSTENRFISLNQNETVTKDLLFAGYNVTPLLLIKSSGNVGIGTTSPSSKLEVINPLNNLTTSSLDNGTVVGLSVGYDDQTLVGGEGVAISLGMKGRGRSYIAHTNTSSNKDESTLIFYNESGNVISERMRILSTGNIGIGTTTPNRLLHVNGIARAITFTADRFAQDGLQGSSYFSPGTTSTLSSQNNLTIQTVNSNTDILITPTGNVGIGTTSPTSQLTQKSTTTLESAPLGSELLTTSNWTSIGWTGDFTTGFSHTTGNTTSLTNSIAAVVNNRYLISFTVTNRTTGTFKVTFGGQNSGDYYSSNGFGILASTTGSLIITPTSDFNGTLQISLKQVTGVYNPIYSILDSTNGSALEIRSSIGSLNNVFIGKNSGRYNISGYGNSTLGVSAFLSNISGNYNVSIGVSSLQANISGNNNIAVGPGSLQSNINGSNNTAIGNSPLLSNTTGFNNTAIGYVALYSMTTGYNNTAVGISSGRFLSDGVALNTTTFNSVYLGANTRANADGVSNEIVIGYNAIGNGSNSVTLGNDSITKTILKGNVGIGTTTPNSKLDVNGNTTITGSLAISQSLIQYSSVASVPSGSVVDVVSFNTGSYTATFFDYVTTSGTSARAGTVFAVWNGNNVEYTETSTNDIGNTNNLVLSASLSAGIIRLQATSLSGSWSVKTLARMI